MELTPKVTFLGLTFDLTVIIGSLLTAVIVFIIAFLGTRNLSMVPKGMQNAIEMLVDFSRGISRMAFDIKTAEKYLSLTFTLFLFILVANQIGVLLMVTTEVHGPIPALGITEEKLKTAHSIAWLKSPTADLNVTFAMAIAVALFAHFMGIFKDPKGYFKHYASFMLPLHLVEEIAKPLTHAMRLWANIFAGEVMITVFLTNGYIFINGLPLLVWMGFSLFVGVIQAYIFTVLANVYIAQKVTSNH